MWCQKNSQKRWINIIFIAMDSLDTEIPQLLCTHCKLAMASDMQIEEYFDRCIFLFIVTTILMTQDPTLDAKSRNLYWYKFWKSFAQSRCQVINFFHCFRLLDNEENYLPAILSSSEVMTVYLKMWGLIYSFGHHSEFKTMAIWALLFQFSCFFLSPNKNPLVFWRLLPCPNNTLNNIKIRINSCSCVFFLSSKVMISLSEFYLPAINKCVCWATLLA